MSALLGWLATYLVHSTVLLAAAWVVDRMVGPRRPQLAETVWRGAVLGALLTTTVQVVLPAASPAALTIPTGSATAAMATLPVGRPAISGHAASEPAPTSPLGAWLASHVAAAAPAVSAIWLVGALLASIRLATAAAALRRLLRARDPRPPGRVVRRLAHALGVRRPVAVSTSRAIPVPFTTGVHRPEVCCPEHLMSELPPRLQASILAHELAHVARYDVAWRRALLGLAAALWLQPLNLVARRRLEALGETLCDRRAAACTGRPRDLAACLVEVAARAATRPLPLAAMAPGRELDHRVHQLLEAPMSEPRSSRLFAVTAVLLIAAGGALLPTVSWTAVAPPPVSSSTTGGTAVAPAAEQPSAPPSPAAAPAPPADSSVDSPPTPAAAPAPAAAPRAGIEDAIVEALRTKSIVDPDIDPAEIRRVVEEVVARETARHERDVARRLREELRLQERTAAAAGRADDRAAEIERRVQEMVERDLAARQAEAAQLAAELAARDRAADSVALEAHAAALEEQARALAEQQDHLREEARRLTEEAARLREQQPQPDPE